MSTIQPAGFLALPSSGEGSPVLVLHPWWGLNETIKNFCARLAEAGFVAFAPDLYHGQVTDTVEGAETLSDALDGDTAAAEVAAAAAFLNARSQGGLAVIGFSLGAFFALNLAETAPEQVRSVVLFYGTRPGNYSAARADFLGHYAENDPFEPREEVDNLEAALHDAGRSVTFYHYADTGHWFFEPDRRDAYNAAAADLAWERTLAFLQRASPPSRSAL